MFCEIRKAKIQGRGRFKIIYYLHNKELDKECVIFIYFLHFVLAEEGGQTFSWRRIRPILKTRKLLIEKKILIADN